MRKNLQQIVDEFRPVIGVLDANRTQARPAGAPDRWSIEQVVEHLLLSYRSTGSVFGTRIRKGTPTQAKPTLQQRLGQFMLIDVGVFPSGREAPAGVVPAAVEAPRAGAELVRAMTASLEELSGLSDEMDQLFPSNRRCASHMVLGPLSVRQWNRFHLIHGRHHLKQVVRIVAQGG